MNAMLSDVAGYSATVHPGSLIFSGGKQAHAG
jgi:hypothetical protein